MMEFVKTPHLWFGLVMLVFLEIVLGVDNIVFIALFVHRVPPLYREKARVIGLGLALLMRFILLSFLSILIGMTKPLFVIASHGFSVHDLILIIGGLFLIYKTTGEMRQRIYEKNQKEEGKSISAVEVAFGSAILQIVIIDIIFSVDSVVTAIGMTHNLFMMMVAVSIAMVVMLVASRKLTQFLERYPAVVILCLSFLLMIGMSLLADGFGFHIPKGYLYTAILFSIMVEFFNEMMGSRK